MYEKLEKLLDYFKSQYGEEFVKELTDDDHYAMQFIPKGCTYVRYSKNDKHKFPYGLIYHDGNQEVFKLTPYGVKIEILHDMKESGLANIQEEKDYKFETYTTEHEWQKHFKAQAIKYVNEFDHKKWFYIAGETGAGKSHLCTSIVFGLASKGISTRYISYPEFLSRMRNNIASAGDMIVGVKNADVLYIDDFLKTIGNTGEVTTFEGRQIIDLVWYRFNNNMPTIISTELKLSQLENIDSALRGRILEASGEFVLQAHGKEKDYRLKSFKNKEKQ